MKISISNIAWSNEAEAEIADLIQTMGLTGVDVAYTKFWPSPSAASPDALLAYRDFWRKRSIEIVGMQSLIYGRPDLMLFGSPAKRQQMHAYLEEVFRLARVLGAGPLVFGSPKNRIKGGMPDDLALSIAVEFFRSLGEVARRENVTLCIEPNPAEYGCDFAVTADEAIRLVSQVDHPGLRLHLDAAIMTMNGENIEACLERAMPYLAHFHVSEPQLAVVGQGRVDHQRFSTCLKQLGYQGWVAIEMRSGQLPADIDAVRTALTFTREVYGD